MCVDCDCAPRWPCPPFIRLLRLISITESFPLLYVLSRRSVNCGGCTDCDGRPAVEGTIVANEGSPCTSRVDEGRSGTGRCCWCN